MGILGGILGSPAELFGDQQNGLINANISNSIGQVIVYGRKHGVNPRLIDIYNEWKAGRLSSLEKELYGPELKRLGLSINE